ncbi:MAG TPA: elongation factor Ts [Ktedonobacterales bacterium]|jgi:elongation factor Ts|nr:elongation factor Ts [Ktedonobacterales bacterium]
MDYTTKDVAKLREETGAGFADCKAALTESKTYEAAVKHLEEKGAKRAEKVKNLERETRQGVITSYLHHGGNLGVLLELNCTTDFVARSDEFKTLARELTLQIAGTDPKYVAFEDVPAETLAALRQAAQDDPEVQKRPAEKRGQIVEGKVKKQLAAQVLLEQPWVKDEKIKVGTLVDEVIRKTGERIVVRRFTRYALGE